MGWVDLDGGAKLAQSTAAGSLISIGLQIAIWKWRRLNTVQVD